MDETVILLGGGEHARVVIECLLAQHKNVVGIFDPKYSGKLMGIDQLGKYDSTFFPEARVIVAIGDNQVRKRVATITRHQFTNAIHPSALISPYANVGLGCMILHGSIVQSQASIGNHVIINTGSQVDHDCIIDDFVHIAPGVVLCGNVSVGKGTLIGSGAIVIPGRKVGQSCIVGAGAVVTRDIPDNVVAVGNPARVIRRIDEPNANFI